MVCSIENDCKCSFSCHLFSHPIVQIMILGTGEGHDGRCCTGFCTRSFLNSSNCDRACYRRGDENILPTALTAARTEVLVHNQGVRGRNTCHTYKQSGAVARTPCSSAAEHHQCSLSLLPPSLPPRHW